MLVFAKKLDQKFLDGIGRDYLLNGLAISPTKPIDAEASIPLLTQDRVYLGSITWFPAKPGYQLLRFILPPLAVALVILAAFPCWWSVMLAGPLALWRSRPRQSKPMHRRSRRVNLGLRMSRRHPRTGSGRATTFCGWYTFSTRFTEVTGVAAADVLGKTLEQFFRATSDTDGWRRLIEETHERTSFRDPEMPATAMQVAKRVSAGWQGVPSQVRAVNSSVSVARQPILPRRSRHRSEQRTLHTMMLSPACRTGYSSANGSTSHWRRMPSRRHASPSSVLTSITSKRSMIRLDTALATVLLQQLSNRLFGVCPFDRHRRPARRRRIRDHPGRYKASLLNPNNSAEGLSRS